MSWHKLWKKKMLHPRFFTTTTAILHHCENESMFPNKISVQNGRYNEKMTLHVVTKYYTLEKCKSDIQLPMDSAAKRSVTRRFVFFMFILLWLLNEPLGNP